MIKTHDLKIHLGEFRLEDINLAIGQNQFFVLMGPTGAGKTVLLEAIAGLVPVNAGRIMIGGGDVTAAPPERRGVSIVYQDYALFPHLSVTQNINYGVRFHRIGKHAAGVRFQRLVRQLSIGHLLKRYPATLSGGELQRVALARALMVDPQVLLLDEPLSALDPGFREEVRHMLKAIHAASGITFLMVTHDFAEALSLAERAAVMHRGRIEQSGRIEDIFRRPCSAFVADFVGMKNILPATFRDHNARTGPLEIALDAATPAGHSHIAIRPEDIAINSSAGPNTFRGIISAIIDQGFSYELHVMVHDICFKSLVHKGALFDAGLREGLDVALSFQPRVVHTF